MDDDNRVIAELDQLSSHSGFEIFADSIKETATDVLFRGVARHNGTLARYVIEIGGREVVIYTFPAVADSVVKHEQLFFSWRVAADSSKRVTP